ncbi:hypothetical protein XBKB1_2270002 [Xenorhabdus bovienii str. kraussei Becker Underwood]|uniref:Uncharacterized protein n=1 Tax=Xenorhabdus bovienii str. kraussei Becker Underwood TaxID=1398204 RepID=A0A077PT40_XENBV|nr:hypothetical protein XBKB1_2270002 [Xenorhabdus bovienii str. kraussei Becker Underwood]
MFGSHIVRFEDVRIVISLSLVYSFNMYNMEGNHASDPNRDQ